MKYKNGLVLGKFMPPHKGHEYLFRFAKQYCNNLTILVDCIKNQPISSELRKQWIEELIPGINVISLKQFMPQYPNEVENFWDIWKTTIYETSGKPDVLIAAMDYGFELAKKLECDFIPLDIDRQSIPISASEIRENPFKNWNFIVESARGYFMKKLCFIGPESTGKTTIAKKLALDFNTVYIPEYAESLIKKQGTFFEHNINEVAFAQIRTEKALERMVNKIMFCDSDIITTLVWSEILFNNSKKELYSIAESQKYDMTFLFYPDTIWINDVHRKLITESPNYNFRLKMFFLMKEKLIQFQRPYTIIKGNFFQKEYLVRNYISTQIFNK